MLYYIKHYVSSIPMEELFYVTELVLNKKK